VISECFNFPVWGTKSKATKLMLAQVIVKPTRTDQDFQSQATIARIAVPTIPSAGNDPSVVTSPPEVDVAVAVGAELAEDLILLTLLAIEADAEETIDERLEEILEPAAESTEFMELYSLEKLEKSEEALEPVRRVLIDDSTELALEIAEREAALVLAAD
jgi:hypothetical protein